jgi:hypothetical protein
MGIGPAIKLFERVRLAVLWRQQGRPRDMPVVVKVGTLTFTPEGRPILEDWTFHVHYMVGEITLNDLWDRLSARYPVERSGRA